jgi:hemerythrin-like metal-binding protein
MNELAEFTKYEIGLAEIDNDHRKLIAIMLRVRNAINNKNYKMCAALLDEFVQQAEDHFLTEEKILKFLKYPDLNSHIVYHQEMIWKAKSVQALCEEARGTAKIKRCFESMCDFLMHDIVHGDMAFKDFLMESGFVK